MKIASFGLYNPLPVQSGSDSYIQFLLDQLSKNNVITHYYFYKDRKQKNHEGNGHKNRFKTIYLKPSVFLNFNKMPQIIAILRPDLYINKSEIQNISSDIVFSDTFTFNVARYLSRKNQCPLILIKHNIEWKYIKNDGSRLYPFLKAYEQYTNIKSDVIITISMRDYQYMISNYHHKKIFYVPHQVDYHVFNPLGPSYHFENDKLNLLFYGSLNRPMNVFALDFIKFELIPLLKKRHLFNKIRMNIFGSGNPPERFHLDKDVDINYLGMVNDPGFYIRGADIVLVPLKNNGGLKIRMLESLNCGKPIIATDEAVYGLSKELKQRIIIKNSAEEFVDAIQTFLKLQEKRNFGNDNFNYWRYELKGASLNNIIHNALNRNT
jgi:glycosyltransferase involved in cell wall biosynthesis